MPRETQGIGDVDVTFPVDGCRQAGIGQNRQPKEYEDDTERHKRV